ncbi:DUF5906 domain-containing protein [Moritella sp.]|uniref:DUF5906 domain-containing protein n=1 Tax=Moritella sp. TaxID=78556 RepID=UPI001D9EE3C2|nr:DUF5906 domain-containing protein [Moritella sp.]MCJ8349179.1 DUF5906 domain-containing protein [Moritella sp.]NQZ39467.1 hypothetical protein [Moritella sp.]
MINFTTFTSTQPCNKNYFVENNKINKNANGVIYAGEAKETIIKDLSFLSDYLNGLGKNQAISLGCFKEGIVNVVTKAKENIPSGSYARSKDNMSTDDTFLAFLDFDDPINGLDMDDPKTIGEFAQKILGENVGVYIRASSSNQILYNNKPVKNCSSWHVYFVCKDTTLENVKKHVNQKMWLNDYGQVTLNNAGSMQVKCGIDLAVFSAERLVFEAKPDFLGDGFKVIPVKDLYLQGDIFHDFFNNEQDEITVKKYIEEAKDKIKPQSEKLKEEFVSNYITPAMNRTDIPLTLQSSWRNILGAFGYIQNPSNSEQWKHATASQFGLNVLNHDLVCSHNANDILYARSQETGSVSKRQAIADLMFEGNEQKAKDFLLKNIAPPKDDETIESYIKGLKLLDVKDLPSKLESTKKGIDLLSQKYSKVMVKQSFRIAVELDDKSSSPIEFASKADWVNFTADLLIPYKKLKNEEYISGNYKISEEFLKSMDVPKFEQIAFNPAVDGDYRKIKNLFRGFPYSYNQSERLVFDNSIKRNDVIRFTEEHYPHAKRFIEHVWDNICDSDDRAARQFLAWIADILQKPDRSPMIAPVLRSEGKGTGKSIVGNIISHLIGTDYAFSTSTAAQIVGNFNAHLANKLFVCGEEMSWGGSVDIGNKIKDCVTSSIQTIEMKGVDVFTLPKYYRLMLITNNEWAVNASKDERRYLVLDVAEHQKQNNEYFASFFESKSKLCKKMLSDLFSLLSSFEYEDIDLSKGVQTKALQAQKINSMSPMEQWWDNCLEAGEIKNYKDNDCSNSPFNLDSTKKLSNDKVEKSFVFNCYLSWLDNVKPNSKERITNAGTFGKQFKKMVSGGEQRLVDSNQKTASGKNAYSLANLVELKEIFYKNYHF